MLSLNIYIKSKTTFCQHNSNWLLENT